MRYNVRLDGRDLHVHDATVSTFPFNRVWAGTQRNINQTETAYFVSFDLESESELTVEVMDAVPDRIEIRPLAHNLSYSRVGQVVSVKISHAAHVTLEINGSHEVLHIFANKPSFYNRETNDIYFGPGIHHPGVIMPQSGQTVHIDEGAVVYGCIFIHKKNNVHIIGRGILDASGFQRGNDVSSGAKTCLKTKILSLGLTPRDANYFGAFVAYACEDLVIEGIIIRDSMFWSMIIRNHCRNVTIDNVKIIGQWRYNTDGINICASENVIVSNCFIRSFDDCVVLRGAYLDGESSDTRNVRVTNCVLWCDWGKNIEIWAGHIPCAISNVVFDNNFLIRVSALAMSITTWFGSTNTRIENIAFRNIFVDTDAAYPARRIQRQEHDEYIPGENSLPKLLRVDCDRLGDFIGEQKQGERGDINRFKIHYKNIAIENIHKLGPGKMLDIEIDAKRNPVEIQNITLHNAETEKIMVSGVISNFNVNGAEWNKCTEQNVVTYAIM
jgi:hypothetical protein